MKRSPKGLLELKPAESGDVAASVEYHIAAGEHWAHGAIRTAGIEIGEGDELKLADARPNADAAHLALITLYQAKRLRRWLNGIRNPAERARALVTVHRTMQFLFPAFQGSLVEIETTIARGRAVKFGGEDGARAHWGDGTVARHAEIKRQVEEEIERLAKTGQRGKMRAYRKVADRAGCSIATVRRAME